MSVSGCQAQKRTNRARLLKPAPASRRFTDGSLFILRMKRSRPARRFRRRSAAIHSLVCHSRRSRLSKTSVICPASDGIGKSGAGGKLVEVGRINLDERQQPTLFYP